MPYPCSLFYPDIKSVTKSDIRFDIRLLIASMLNHTINLDFTNNIYGMINMEAIPKFYICIKFDISAKPPTWIGHESHSLTPALRPKVVK